MAVETDHVVSDPRYYLRETSTIAPKFAGRGSRLLGIEGTWDERTYLNLFEGYATGDDGERIKLASRIDKDRRGAVDFTFNRDKATSVLKLVSGDDRIDAVETRAELKAMRQVEKQVRVRVRKQSQLMESKAKHPKGWKYPERTTDNLIWVAFRHPVSREGDPHSHTHFVVMNLSWDGAEKNWKAVELRYIDRKGISETYHKELAKGLRKLGYDAKWDGKLLDVKGIPKDVQDEFSQRHRGIKTLEREFDERADAAELPKMSGKARGKLSVYKRPEKPAEVPLEERRKNWMSRLSDLQRRVVLGAVGEAKQSTRRGRWRTSLARHAEKLRTFARHLEPSHERERGRGR